MYHHIGLGPIKGRCNGCHHLYSFTMFDDVSFIGTRFYCNKANQKAIAGNGRHIGDYDRAFPDVTCPNWCPVVKH